MFPDKQKKCPFTGFTKSCFELVSSGDCQDRWVTIRGANPTTGDLIDRPGCIHDWEWIFRLENTQVQHQTSAAMNALRSEMVPIANAMGQMAALANAAAAARRLQHTVDVIEPPRNITP